jgi:signal transduction histidine kinase
MLSANYSLPRRLLKIAAVAIVYYFAARTGLLLQLGHTNSTPVWPPSGIAFAALILLGFEIWPGIMLGAFIANVVVFEVNKVAGTPTILFMSLCISIGNSLEAIIGYYLLKRLKSFEVLGVARDFAMFFIAVLIMCLASSIVGATTLLLNNIITMPEYSSVWFTWWTGDVSGIIILTPIILTWWNPRKREWNTTAIIQVAGLFILLTLYLLALFGNWSPLGINKARIFFIFLIISLCVFCMSQRQISLVILGISLSAIYATHLGMGPFIENSVNGSYIALQAFLCVVSVTAMFLSTTLNERRKTEEQLKEVNAKLEVKVTERTQSIERQKEELTEMNSRLLEKTRELERINKESRSFAHAVSHDLREPLRTITSYLQLIEERYKDKLDNDADIFIDFAVEGAKRMNTLIDDMLIYSRIEHSNNSYVNVDLNDIMVLVKNNLQTTIQQNNAEIIIDKVLPAVTAEHYQMVQLFQNLVENAIKYRGERTPVIRISAKKQTDEWLISISDNGIGISKEHFDRVFIIFQRLHGWDQYEGTGIGLAICKRIIERHGGQIWVESTEGNGATFYFTIKG